MGLLIETIYHFNNHNDKFQLKFLGNLAPNKLFILLLYMHGLIGLNRLYLGVRFCIFASWVVRWLSKKS